MSTYYKVKVNNKKSIVKSNGAIPVRKMILEALKDAYAYERASTDDVVGYMSKGNEVIDLTKNDGINFEHSGVIVENNTMVDKE